MSTNIADFGFDESGGGIAVYLCTDPGTVSPIEAVDISIHEHGVYIRSTVGGGRIQFVPHSNIAEIRQSV